MSENKLLYQIALSNIPGVGDINARRLLEYYGTIEDIFSESYNSLIRIPGIGSSIARSVSENRSLERAKKEVDFISRYGINTAFISDENYPGRLKECPDAPILIYYKGDIKADAVKVLSIVGTRNATRQGKDLCREIISDLASRHAGLVIVSGLAYGIDICAHKASLSNNIPTLGIMAHGFRTLYPSAHTQVARDMLLYGGLITDFLSDTGPDRNNFLKRNRIIAGLADATLVVESGVKGGAMVTADIAVSYNRDVLAVPGSPGSKYSAGCNLLLKSQKACLVENSTDIEYFLNWTPDGSLQAKQARLIPELSELEKNILEIIAEKSRISSDELCSITGRQIQHISPALLSLEFAGLILSRPGNIYIHRRD